MRLSTDSLAGQLAAWARRERPEARVGACPDPNLLAAYRDGVIDAEERAALELHASSCDDCRMELADLARLVFRLDYPGADPNAVGGPHHLTRLVAVLAAAILLSVGLWIARPVLDIRTFWRSESPERPARPVQPVARRAAAPAPSTGNAAAVLTPAGLTTALPGASPAPIAPAGELAAAAAPQPAAPDSERTAAPPPAAAIALARGPDAPRPPPGAGASDFLMGARDTPEPAEVPRSPAAAGPPPGLDSASAGGAIDAEPVAESEPPPGELDPAPASEPESARPGVSFERQALLTQGETAAERYSNQAVDHYINGETHKALAYLQTALRRDGELKEAHFNIALLYEVQGLDEQAVEHWNRYLALAPDGPFASFARARLAR